MVDVCALLEGKKHLPDAGEMIFMPIRLSSFASDMTSRHSSEILCFNKETKTASIVSSSWHEDFFIDGSSEITVSREISDVEEIYLSGTPTSGYSFAPLVLHNSQTVSEEEGKFNLSVLDIFPDNNSLRHTCMENIALITEGEERDFAATTPEQYETFENIVNSFPIIHSSWASNKKSATK